MPTDYEINPESVEEVLVKKINENPKTISIVAIGPLTNLANALSINQEFVNNVDELVIMGGDEGGGNITPYAEFNIYQDPEAAKKVFDAGFKKITMIGFNVSKMVTLCPEIEIFLKQNGEIGRFIYDITRVTANLDREKNKVDGAIMNDILTLLYLIWDEKMFKKKQADVLVDTSKEETRGRTEIKEGTNGSASCNIVTTVDGTLIIREMLTKLFPGQEDAIEKVLKNRQERIEYRDYMLSKFPEKREKILKLFNGESSEQAIKVAIEEMKEQ